MVVNKCSTNKIRSRICGLSTCLSPYMECCLKKNHQIVFNNESSSLFAVCSKKDGQRKYKTGTNLKLLWIILFYQSMFSGSEKEATRMNKILIIGLLGAILLALSCENIDLSISFLIETPTQVLY